MPSDDLILNVRQIAGYPPVSGNVPATASLILQLAGLLDDDRIPSFAALTRARLALLPAPMAANVGHWLRTRSYGGPSRPAMSTPSG